MDLLELFGRKFAGMNPFHLSGLIGRIGEGWSYDMSRAISTYRPKFLSISASALGGRGNEATSRDMLSKVRDQVVSAFVWGHRMVVFSSYGTHAWLLSGS